MGLTTANCFQLSQASFNIAVCSDECFRLHTEISFLVIEFVFGPCSLTRDLFSMRLNRTHLEIPRGTCCGRASQKSTVITPENLRIARYVEGRGLASASIRRILSSARLSIWRGRGDRSGATRVRGGSCLVGYTQQRRLVVTPGSPISFFLSLLFFPPTRAASANYFARNRLETKKPPTHGALPLVRFAMVSQYQLRGTCQELHTRARCGGGAVAYRVSPA